VSRGAPLLLTLCPTVVAAAACNRACVGLASYRPLRRRRLDIASAYASSRCRGHRLAIYGVAVAHAMLPQRLRTPRFDVAS
jgi:hypothetical protein